jgi:hypothetical protein
MKKFYSVEKKDRFAAIWCSDLAVGHAGNFAIGLKREFRKHFICAEAKAVPATVIRIKIFFSTRHCLSSEAFETGRWKKTGEPGDLPDV